jgi:hypothetical protein
MSDQPVTFHLYVYTNGDPKDDQAFWLVPRITE